MINSILSQIGAKYLCFDIEFFYLSTPLGRPEYVRIQLSKIPQEFIEEYNLTIFSHKGGYTLKSVVDATDYLGLEFWQTTN